MKNILLFIIAGFLLKGSFAQSVTKTFDIKKRYLNIPIQKSENRIKTYFLKGADTITYAVIRIADTKPDYWVYTDVSAFIGQKITIKFEGNARGIESIYNADVMIGSDSLYKEKLRPQFHFTTQRGWINDPNGLVYQNGIYHLFYQHNPYETEWENMHWGHAISNDLLHWKELPTALFPDKLGTIFSGSAVIDKQNDAGFGKNALLAFYTTAGKSMAQNVAYSLDSGKSFVKFAGNPIVGPDRDPKVFWHQPTKRWVMALYNENTITIYNSIDLKKWVEVSKNKGFYECPELFELDVDGNANNKKWVMYAASGTYMIGGFDGKKFTPTSGKFYYNWGTQYAAQTYNNTPDNRRIQIGWGRHEMPGMPFNQQMLFPNQLSLKTTPQGLRLFCEPIKEISQLHGKSYAFKNIKAPELNKYLDTIRGDLFHGIMDVELDKGLGIELYFRGNPILYFDGNFNRFNGAPYVCDGAPGSMRFTIEFLIDKNSVEGYVGGGKLFISDMLHIKNNQGLQLIGDIKVHNFKLYEMNSIW